MGNGNTWVGDDKKYRGWKLVCVCGTNKIVTSHNTGGSLPPHILFKKFTQAGWLIGKTSADDLCPHCYYEHLLDRKNKPDKIKAAITNAEVAAAQANVATADHQPIDVISIKNQAHELALLAQIAAEDADYKLLDEALTALVKLCATLPEVAFEAPRAEHRAEANKFKVGDPQRAADLDYDEAKKDQDFDQWLSEQQLIHEQHSRRGPHLK